MSKYIHKLDCHVVEAKQITRKQGNELRFNNGVTEVLPEKAFLLTHAVVGDWVISTREVGDRLMGASEFNKQYENYFEKEEV